MERSTAVGILDPDFVTEQVVVGPNAGWIVGWKGGPTLEDRVGMVIRVDKILHREWEAPGWVRAVDEGLFAVHVRPGPQFTLLRRNLGGWEALGDVPGQSVSQVLAVSYEEAWLLGADTLIRWKGGFSSLSAPGDRDPTRERLFLCGPQVVLAGPEGLWLAREEGKRWARRHTDGAHVRALNFPYVAAPGPSKIRIGRLEPAFLSWMGDVMGEGDPFAFGWTGNRMQLLIAPADPGRVPGIVHVFSRPEGGFASELLHISHPSRVGIRGASRLLLVLPDRTVMWVNPCPGS